MNRIRPFLFLLIALLLGVVAMWLGGRWLQHQADLSTQRVVVAKQSIKPGETLVLDRLALIDWPARSMPPGVIVDAARLDGRVALLPIEQGEPVLESKLAMEGSKAGLSALIADGKRAISIKVSEENGVAGFVRPGSLVDVMTNTKNSLGEPMSKIILENVLVLASAQDFNRDETKPKVANAVTLEVTPDQATLLDLARNVGTLSLVMRNPQDFKKLGNELPLIDKKRMLGAGVTNASSTNSSPSTAASVGRSSGLVGLEVIRGTKRGQDAN